MSYYDEEFNPWEIIGRQCVVANESEWKKLFEWNSNTAQCPSCKKFYYPHTGVTCCGRVGSLFIKNARPIVKVTTDIFKDVEWPIVDSQGYRLVDASSDSPWVSSPPEWMQTHKSIDSRNILTRLFKAIGSTPHVDYLLMTQRPDLVRWKWIGCERDYNKDGDCDRHENGCPKSNVILATYIETQDDVERLVPELLKCHSLCKGLAVICNPKEELDFTFIRLPPSTYLNSLTGQIGSLKETESGPSLDLLIVEGNESPMHPDHVRSLRDQCLDANVKFNFASWGDWAPRTTHEESLTGQEQHTAFIDGMPEDKFPEDYRMVNWGREHSGRLLDGREHNGRLQ